MISTARTGETAQRERIRALLPGLLAAAAIGAAATALATGVPLLGAPVLAVLLGLVTRTVADRRGEPGNRGPREAGGHGAGEHGAGEHGAGEHGAGEHSAGEHGAGEHGAGGHGDGGHGDGERRDGAAALHAGSRFAGRHVLQAAVVLLGTGLSMRSVLDTGVASLPVMLGTLALCLVAAWLLGRLLRIPDPLRTLIGAGTGICGASAIAALRGIVVADEVSVAYAVSTIVVYNITAAVVFPPVGRLLGLSQHAFGLWAGTAVNDTSSVVATGYAYGAVAGRYAVTVKLTRALMIIPVAFGVAARARRSAGAGAEVGAGAGDEAGAGGRDAGPAPRTPVWRLVPPFLVLFLLAAAANSTGLVPAGWQGALAHLAGYLVAVALAGIGLGVRLRELRRAGLRPLAFGGLLSVLVACASLGLQALTAR